ncbi:MAG: nuclear transport factor 2 family protein [Sphingobacterium composti]|uniref:nuclear transport factor 2 family protein n=1 Tax=Sphingobacterium composti TaxID=363260 RepID=UPI00135A4272|nr:nuclear transport factor 2 family protein [Sphingobacterium composti Ten et al. 2007 non Yoo et al. 2007]
MKHFLFIALSVITFTACGQQQNSTKKTNQQSENFNTEKNMEDIAKPVKALIEAMQAEDAQAIRAQFSDKATQAYGADGAMKTAAETYKWIQTDIIDRKGKVANPKIEIISGNEVVVTGQYSSIGYTNKANFLFTVKDGLITSWRMRY